MVTVQFLFNNNALRGLTTIFERRTIIAFSPLKFGLHFLLPQNNKEQCRVKKFLVNSSM